MYDGNVAVYNLQVNPTDPIYISKGVNGKHSDVVWEVIFSLNVSALQFLYYIVFFIVDKMGTRYD